LTAGACVLGLVAVAVLALDVEAAHERDTVLLRGFAGLYWSGGEPAIKAMASLADPLPYAFIGALCMAVALARRRAWRAMAVAGVLVGTGVTTQALKHLLAQPRFADFLGGDQVEDVSWPSGHATAALTLALCAVIAVPPAWRAATALAGGAYAVGVAYATLVLTWHYPSDSFGGFLVAGLWASVALALLERHEAGDPAPAPPPPPRWLGVTVAGGMLVAAALLAAASARVGLDAADTATVLLGGLALAVLGVALVFATMTAVGEGGVLRGSGVSPDGSGLVGASAGARASSPPTPRRREGRGADR
jgi:membrane-associated phospholipid phosphatase